jgi:hypothetical protein
MSVIKFESKDIGAVAWSIIANNNYRDAFPITRDKYESKIFKMNGDDEDKRIKCFFDRVFIANQLAYYTSYQDECDEKGAFKIERLQDEDIAPFSKSRNRCLNSARAIYNELTSIRYNLISQAGRSFLDEQDSERLENLINHMAHEIIELSDPDRAVYGGD